MDWNPPDKDSQGRYHFGDWRPLRDAIDKAREVLREQGDIDRRDWNLVGLALHYHQFATTPTCLECRKPIEGLVIRCLDCKQPMHERCAAHHFWPNGRPSGQPNPTRCANERK